ncbi:hypothetical protein BDV12DRAFT_202339 [Aspergillus spectabilis]
MRATFAEIAGSNVALPGVRSPGVQRDPASHRVDQSSQPFSPGHPIDPSASPSTDNSPFPPLGSPSYSQSLHDSLSLLAPDSLIHAVLDDWFEHVHPLAPVLHRRRFLTRFHNGDAYNDRIFCGLVISVLCATCATLRRKSLAEYHPITLNRCVQFIQSHDLLPADGPYSLDWCVAKYNLATASMVHRDMSDPWTHRMFSEAMMGTRYLFIYKIDEMSTIDRELCKRLYCLLEISMMCVCIPRGLLEQLVLTKILFSNVDMLGQPVLGRLALKSSAERRPCFFTDEEIAPVTPATEFNVPSWHGDNISYVPGLTHLLDIFLSWHHCQTDRFYLPPEQVLSYGLSRVQNSIDNLPPELRWRGGLSRPQTATSGHDVQIANIFITSLYVRSNLLQQFGKPSLHQREHQSIASDLLEVLYHLPQPILEANRYSLIPKIRDIGGAYLDVLQIRQGDVEVVAIDDEAKGKLERLLRKLGVLDLDFRPDMSSYELGKGENHRIL